MSPLLARFYRADGGCHVELPGLDIDMADQVMAKALLGFTGPCNTSRGPATFTVRSDAASVTLIVASQGQRRPWESHASFPADAFARFLWSPKVELLDLVTVTKAMA